MKKERQDETQFTTKLVEKLVWVPVISLCKIFIPNYMFGCVFFMQQKCGPQLQWNSNVSPNSFCKTLMDFKGPLPLDLHVTIRGHETLTIYSCVSLEPQCDISGDSPCCRPCVLYTQCSETHKSLA